MSNHQESTLSRRSFLQHSASCGAYIAGLAALSPLTARRVFAQTGGDVVVKEEWGRIEKIHDNVWALVSTFETGNRTTICNGGIVAGDRGVLAIETFMTPEGAKCLAEWSEKLTGKWPTDVVVTHFHGDHSMGVAGYEKDGKSPRMWLTEKTEELINGSQNAPQYPQVSRLSTTGANQLDLGNRQVSIYPRSGHTPSDVTIEVNDPNVVFAGDLFFNRMVPNYGDAIAKVLTEEVGKLVREKETTYVPGHGPVASASDLQLYREFLDMIEQSARAAHAAGTSVERAAEAFKLPDKFKDWYIFSPQVMPRAFAAWYQALEE